ncbi:MAG: rane fusion protein multidrug efflux system [Methylobacteriaceae bacterium]|jgi:multidrug efflux system membrane fusion protein|nr:rane fusion protein multidrug efflux system [Methylobacteriaceae bacterium]
MRASRLFIGTVVIALGAAGAFYGYQRIATQPVRAENAPPPAAAIAVPVVPVKKEDVPIYLDYVATTEAMRTVALQAKITGYLLQRGAPDGADVKEGDLLYKIDPRDYQAALDQTKAQVQKDQAALSYSRATQNRSATLVQQGYTSRDQFDQTTSTLGQAQAALAADQAAERTAQNNLVYTEIRAPFPGRIGRSLVHEGTLISAAGTQLNTLVQLDPIYVTFNPAETDVPKLEARRKQGDVGAEVFLTGDTEPRYKGNLVFLDNVVDRASGTITARAQVDNPDRALLPGQFVRVRLAIGTTPNALLVPQAAIGASQTGQYLYTLSPDNKAEQRFVALGARYGDRVVVTGPVKEGDKVIVGNLQRLSPNTLVQPQEQTAAAGQ